MRRMPSPLALFLLAPLIGEYLLGNIPLGNVWSLISFVPTALLYGGGAVLIREVAVRASGGWAMAFLLALAYGLIEEGLVTQSLFNLNYLGLGLGSYGVVPGLGISIPWTIYVLSIHSVWSIFVPIVLVETLYGLDRRPRLRPRGLVLNAVLYVVGALLLFAAMYTNETNARFLLGPGQLAGTLVLVALLIAAAFATRTVHLGRTTRRAWPPAALTAFALAAGSALFLVFEFGPDRKALPESLTLVAVLALLAVVGAVLIVNARTADWSHRHVLALAAGAVLTYCWVGFMVQITQYGFHLVPTIAQVVLVAGALALLSRARLPIRRGAGMESRHRVPQKEDSEGPDRRMP